MRRPCSLVLALAALAPVAAGGAAPLAASGAEPSRASRVEPRLAVILVADGLSWDRLNSWRPWFTSGLKRLLDEGAVATRCRYDHLNTETGPGHASIATGAPPRVHGIALNQWYVPAPDGKTMEAIYSASQPVAGAAADSPNTILGPGRLLVPTLGDRLTERDPRAKVVAISNKDRAAILMAGRDARHVAYWYSSNDATYVTSAAYDDASPAGAAAAKVVRRFNRDKAGAALEARVGTTWSRLPAPEPVPAPGFETGLDGYQDQIVGPAFPHDLAAAKRPFPSALLWTPVADGLLTDLALDLVADDELGLGRDDVPDILAVSFSANDYVSHFYGPDSVEDLEVLRALDLDIGRLLDALTSRFGKEGVVVALSADHGFLPLPEATKRHDPQAAGERVSDAAILDGLNRAVNAALKRTGTPNLVYRFEGCSLWLDRAALAAPGAPSARRVLSIVKRELATTWKGVVATTLPVDAGAAPRGKDDLRRRAWNAAVTGRSGDLLVVARYGVLVDHYGGKGSSHGTPWEYDTHVPMIFWGDGVRVAEIVAPTTPYDLAPTLGARIGVTLPAATGTRLELPH